MAERTQQGDDGLVAAAISTLTNSYIISQREFQESFGREMTERRHNISVGHSNSVQLSGRATPRRFSVSMCENVSTVFIKDTRDRFYSLAVDMESVTIEHLKRMISCETGVDRRMQQLIYGGKVLENDRTLKWYGVCREATIFLGCDLERSVTPMGPQYLAQSDLAPGFNYDFRKLRDEGREYRRGGRGYKRPYGWERFGLNVLGKYEPGDKWLGERGERTHESPKEWAVSFHGVMEFEVLRREEGECPVRRVYSTPDIGCRRFSEFVKRFSYRGKWYSAVFQNRINPDQLSLTPEGDFICGIADIRPYGICVRETETI